MRLDRWVKVGLLGVLFLGLNGAGLSAGSSDDSSTRAYIYIKQNSDLYVGEGLAVLNEFDGDEVKANTAARERAKSSLADSVHVNVKSETTEKLQSKNGVASEDLKSVSTSRTDVDLENVKYLELKDYPVSGKITVLASLSKEDYRRQLAGKKVSVYLPENGLRFKLLGNDYTWLKGNDPELDFGLEFIKNSFMVGFDETNHKVKYPNGYSDPAGGIIGQNKLSVTRVSGMLGYNWTPWAQRVQVYFPARLEYQWVSMASSSAHLLGASGGLGLRFWPNDTLALDLTGRYSVGLNKVEFSPAPGMTYTSSLDGLEVDIGILWSGF